VQFHFIIFSPNKDKAFNFKNLNENKSDLSITDVKMQKLSWIFHIMIL